MQSLFSFCIFLSWFFTSIRFDTHEHSKVLVKSRFCHCCINDYILEVRLSPMPSHFPLPTKPKFLCLLRWNEIYLPQILILNSCNFNKKSLEFNLETEFVVVIVKQPCCKQAKTWVCFSLSASPPSCLLELQEHRSPLHVYTNKPTNRPVFNWIESIRYKNKLNAGFHALSKLMQLHGDSFSRQKIKTFGSSMPWDACFVTGFIDTSVN